jgi:hypothetical protein
VNSCYIFFICADNIPLPCGPPTDVPLPPSPPPSFEEIPLPPGPPPSAPLPPGPPPQATPLSPPTSPRASIHENISRNSLLPAINTTTAPSAQLAGGLVPPPPPPRFTNPTMPGMIFQCRQIVVIAIIFRLSGSPSSSYPSANTCCCLNSNPYHSPIRNAQC